jgi:hypothetical protein
MSEEEEKKLSLLEKRLVANVDFDDQALNSLGFGMDIYYMLGHLGWVQFSNGVSANTHKEFALEILMTMTPILDEGCRVYHSSWREFSKWFPMKILGSTWFPKGSSGESRHAGRHVGWILELDLGGSPPTKEFHPEPHHASVSLMDE